MDPNVLHNIGYGMYVVASYCGSRYNAQIVNTAFQITSRPVIVAISINKENLTHQFISESQRFSLSILAEETPLNFIGRFGFKSGKDTNKFKDIKVKTLVSGCPVVLDNALCFLEARVLNSIDCGTHTLFLGEMAESEMLREGRPLTYEYYHQVKCGTTPKSAPTFIESETPEACNLPKYRCTVCNYIYDPGRGDPEGGIAAGTAFEKIPDNWQCPICGVGKDKFVRQG